MGHHLLFFYCHGWLKNTLFFNSDVIYLNILYFKKWSWSSWSFTALLLKTVVCVNNLFWLLGIALKQQAAFPVSQVTSSRQGSPHGHLTCAHSFAHELSPLSHLPFFFHFWLQLPPWFNSGTPSYPLPPIKFPFHISNGLKSPLSSCCFIALPFPLQGLNSPSVRARSLNYSVSCCCSPQRAISNTLTQKWGKSRYSDSMMAECEGSGGRVIDWWQQVVWLGASQETPHLSSSSSTTSSARAAQIT